MMSLILPPGALRLALACIVVTSHYAFLSHAPVYVLADSAAVVGFFFFSGYWVARLWQTKYSRCRAPLLTFYASRAARVYPLALLATLAMAAMTPTDLPILVWNVALFGVQFGSALNPPAWSLAIELQFYFVAPLLFVSMKNRGVAALILGLSFCAWIPFAVNWMPPYLPGFILTFALGAGYAQYPRHDLAVRWAPVGLAVFVLVSVIPNITHPSLPLDSFWRFIMIVASMAMLPYIAASLSKRSDERDRRLGDLAYPVYLFHWPIFLIAAKVAPEHPIVVALPFTAVGSAALLWLVDRPLETWRHAFVARRVRLEAENIRDPTAVPSVPYG
jgi:peptidoglycan/LPS O-acetylase OafA/YrhL